MGGLERPRAKRVAREVEVRRSGRGVAEPALVVWAWGNGVGSGDVVWRTKGLVIILVRSPLSETKRVLR